MSKPLDDVLAWIAATNRWQSCAGRDQRRRRVIARSPKLQGKDTTLINHLHSAAVSRDDADVGRDTVVRLRISEAEANAWKAAAEDAGLTLSEFIRRRVTGETRIEPPPPVVAAPPPKTKRRR